MRILKYRPFPPLLFGVVTAALQVSVTLHNEYVPGFEVSMTCSNLLPGQCCTAPQTPFRSYSAHVVSFRGLAPWHIAAIWRSRVQTLGQFDLSASYTGCSSEVWRSRTGPGTWTWEMWGEADVANSLIPATGASYIDLPRTLPPDERVSNWLSAQGILGLVWGGGKWFSSPAASRLLGYDGSVGQKSRLRRNSQPNLKGIVYVGLPRYWVLPTYMDLNGTRYVAESGSYADKFGMVLNLTNWTISR